MDRRDFLRTTGWVGATAMCAPSIVW